MLVNTKKRPIIQSNQTKIDPKKGIFNLVNKDKNGVQRAKNRMEADIKGLGDPMMKKNCYLKF